jgi:hypothetical protein
MGLTFAHIKDKPKKLQALTGLTRTEFDDLLVAFDMVSQANAAAPGQRRPRQRQVADGRKAALQSSEDRLLFTLVYLKTYPLQEITEELFGMEMSKANEWIHRLLPYVCDALDELGVMPERDVRTIARTPGKQRKVQAAMLADTEQRSPHPKKQVMRHRGKKKVRTHKNLIMAGRT